MVQVVGFADELALQSKVLSVNAAIEAAKAGDRGQGFSAVATEVKSLANQSKEATREVRQILKEIQKSIADVRRSIAMGNETVDLASDQCRSTAESIRGLDGSVSSSRDAAETILGSSKEQVQGIMQLSHAMNDIQTVSEQSFGSLGNLQVEAQKLNNIAKELISDMKGYQIMIDQLLATCASLSKQESAG
jgi:methyl-accepting chemotaxis protein